MGAEPARFARQRMWLRNMRDNFMRAMVPQTEADLRMVEAQLDISRKQTAPTTFTLPFTAIVVAATNFYWVPTLRLLLWPLAVTLLSAVAEVIYLHFLKHDDHSAASVRYRAKMAVTMGAVLVAAWCSMVFVIWVPGVPGNHLLILFLLCASLSGWVTTGAVYLPMLFVTLPIYLIAMTAVPMFAGDMIDAILGWLCIGFWVMMASQASMNFEAYTKRLKLEDERVLLIEDLQRAKETSDRARERAEAASRAKSTFLANMSHELRTPLNAILGFSEIIKTRAFGESIDQYAEYGSYIHGSGQHLLTLINDILDLAKIEAGRMTLREDDVDVVRLIEDCVEMMNVKAQQAGVKLAITAESGFPLLYADERALRQIIVNLLSNAVKFTPLGGIVTCFVKRAPDGKPSFGVSDTGIGIAPEDYRRVFESFGQGRHDAVQADKSTGLGLPIVKGLAEAHGGTVLLDSVPGQGTIVTILMPAARLRARIETLRAAS
ncbi:MAG TPA: HAMP domain-containing sensor histidine kinase [Rhizomicrobium sp.]